MIKISYLLSQKDLDLLSNCVAPKKYSTLPDNADEMEDVGLVLIRDAMVDGHNGWMIYTTMAGMYVLGYADKEELDAEENQE